jgi:hypothetical protein
MYDARYIDLYGCGGLTGDVSHWLAMASASVRAAQGRLSTLSVSPS